MQWMSCRPSRTAGEGCSEPWTLPQQIEICTRSDGYPPLEGLRARPRQGRQRFSVVCKGWGSGTVNRDLRLLGSYIISILVFCWSCFLVSPTYYFVCFKVLQRGSRHVFMRHRQPAAIDILTLVLSQ